MAEVKATFSFGENWEQFIAKHYTPDRIEISQKHILDFLQTNSLEGKYFLDVGCGSGLSSLAALKAGASRIVSFDVDPHSVAATRYVRQLHGNPEHWTVLEGSALDK